MKPPNFNIYTGNHRSTGDSQDYYLLIEGWIKNSGYQYSISNYLEPGKINVILENFANYYSNQEIIQFKKKHPKSIIIIVLSEFVERHFCQTSFNNFGGIFNAGIIAVTQLILGVRRPDIIRLGFMDAIRTALFGPIVITFILSVFLRAIFYKNIDKSKSAKEFCRNILYNQAKFHLRFLSLKKFLPLMDWIVCGHRDILTGLVNCNIVSSDDPRLGDVIYPTFEVQRTLKKLITDKVLGLGISGPLTPYRQSYVSNLDDLLLRYGLTSKISAVEVFQRQSINKSRPYMYALQIPKERSWPYSSPMQIFRALSLEFSLPVTSKFFHDHPIENLCLDFSGIDGVCKLIKFYECPSLINSFLEPKIIEYNKSALEHNYMLIEKIISS